MNLVFRLYIGLSVLWILEAVAQRRPPNYSQDKMPVTSFSCRDKILGGYYADPETDCQMFHVCVKVPGLGVQDYKFLCPNNTSFDQENQICDDWYNIDCEASTLYYSDNFDLYRIGSDVGGERVKDVARLPNININNAVSDHDDDYLQKSDRGENVGSDILRGSQSGNFFSNKNRGKEDDFEETKKKKTNGKSNVRKLLTGKRPVTSTTTQVYQATSQPRSNFGRNRVASNFNRGTETYSTTPKASYYENTQNYNSQSTTPRTSTLNTNYETQKLYRLNTQSFQQYDEPSNGEFLKTAPSQNLGASNFNRVQNSYKSFNASVSSSYNFISPSTQKATTYQSTPAPFQKQYPTTQNYYTTTQKQQNFNNPKAQQQNYKPSTQNFNSPKAQQQNYQSSTQNYYSTTQKPQNFYNPSTQQQNYQPSTQNFNNPTTQKQQNFNKLKTQQQNYNPSTQNYYSTTQKPQNYYNPSTQQQNYQPNTQTQKQQNFFNPSTQQQNYNPSTQNYYSTTQKPQNFYNPSTQQQNYNPSTQNFNNPTTQKQQNFYNPSTQQQNYQPSTQFKNPTTQNFYNPSTQQQNLNNPTTQNYNQQNYYSTTAKPYPTTQKQQTTRQQFNPTQNFYTTTQKTELAQSVATTPRQKAQNSFFIPNGPTRGSATFAVTDATEKPRPFTNQPLKETKEKEQYDYAYYDDAPHAEYENIDALDFARTKSKKN